jgi:hypothetical protein
MTDTFKTHGRSLTSPPEDAAAIVPDDGQDLATATRAIWVGGGGDLRLRMLGGAEVTLHGVAGGSLLPLRVARVFATGTTATALVGLW